MKPQKGVLDKASETCENEEKILNEFKGLCSLFSISRVKTPIIESRSLFERSLGSSSDVVSKEMFKVGSGNRVSESFDKLVLRPEGTVSVLRQYLNSKSPYPLRAFYIGSMFRKENPQKGRFREFTQGGIEFIKTKNVDVLDGLFCAYKLLENLKVKSALKLNYLGSKSTQKRVKEFLTEKLDSDKLSIDSKNRLKKNPLRILDSKDQDDLDYLNSLNFNYKNFLSPEEVANLDSILDFLNSKNINFTLDTSLVRGLDYYQNLVFEFQSSDLGSQSAVLAGGEYSNLLGMKDSCFGWAFGLERLELLTSSISSPKSGLICLTKSSSDELQYLEAIRDQNISVLPIFKKNIQKSMDMANKMDLDFVLIIGEEEIKNQILTVKNMSTGEQKSLKIEELKRFIKK